MFMRVEYFAEGSADCPLILLYGRDSKDAQILSEALQKLSEFDEGRLAIHELPGFSAVDGCELFASHFPTDVGVKMIQSPNRFECFLRPQSLENIVGLLEPFCRSENVSATSFQYLDASGDAKLLISTERAW